MINQLPTIPGLPVIEYIETTDDETGRKFTVCFVDGREVAFNVLRFDMPYLSRVMVAMRTRQAWEAKYAVAS